MEQPYRRFSADGEWVREYALTKERFYEALDTDEFEPMKEGTSLVALHKVGPQAQDVTDVLNDTFVRGVRVVS